MNNLINLFADKDSTKKKFLSLEKNIKNLYDLIMAQQGTTGKEDDAMFTKKYVGPVNCASCEKGITNLLGTQADYLSWKRLPFREPTERIARYGQGFSKILTMMRPSEPLGGGQSKEDLHAASQSRSPEKAYMTDEGEDLRRRSMTNMSPNPKNKARKDNNNYIDSIHMTAEAKKSGHKSSMHNIHKFQSPMKAKQTRTTI